ncbi:hypothetical protein GMORB2_6225 [Geosmithia morbida]|uniref:Uncharacterized protein n=1 Tax=Geosmithia morbida TaxID=1094350 RepID=A0A9P4YYU7_9HYPO|nr:uncharacterized protein GMORB2_6225 [Geosmithia morbida]KAF4123524.1 hypothetical protein GMORB2_6225 [Geosmithia morbida]
MKAAWKTSHAPDGRMSSPANMDRDHRSIRGRISGPIPIASSIDSDTLADLPLPPDAAVARTLTPPMLVEDNDESPDRTPERNNMPSTPPSVLSRHIHIAHDSKPSSRASNAIRDVHPPRVIHQMDQSSATIRASMTSNGTAETFEDKPQRSRSMLRGAIGKLFGRRKKSVSQITPSVKSSYRQPPETSPPHRRSKSEAVPGMNQKGPLSRERPVSVPLQELTEPTRSSPTGSGRLQNVDSTRTSYGAGRNFSRGRASTSPFRPLETRPGEPTGLTPRPASSSGRINKGQSQVENPEEIGRAITMDSTGLKRRSRSLSVLFDSDGGANEKVGVENDIRYWRKSYESVDRSQLSTAHQDDGNHVIQPVEEAGMDRDMNVQVEDVNAEVEDIDMEVEAPPPEAHTETANPIFDMSCINELSGTKLTQAANTQTTMLNIERRLVQLEQDVADLSQSQNQPDLDPDQSPGKGSSAERNKRNRTLPLRDSDSSALWYNDSQTAASVANSTSTGRPPSISTIRGAARATSMTRDINGPFTVDHYATLISLLETERSAREALEDKVRGLNNQVMLLSKAIDAASRGGLGKASKMSLGSVFNDDDDGGVGVDGHDDEQHGYRTIPTTRLAGKRVRHSGSASSSHMANHSEAESSINTLENDESASYYATPYEYEDDAEDDGRQNYGNVNGTTKADRTMSLSQLTMKSPAQVTHDPLPSDGWPRIFV